MSLEKSEAIVIRTVDFSETSLILDMFTRDHGKIGALAKGARRLKNPFESALDVLARISVSFIRKNFDSLDLLTEAKLISRFRPSDAGMVGLYAGFYLSELLRTLTEEGEPMPELYDLASDTLDRFQKGRHIAEYLFRFEWGLLECSGQRPSTDVCIGCGAGIHPERLGENDTAALAIEDGGAVCPKCRRTRKFRQIVQVAPATVQWLNQLELDAEPPFFKDESHQVRREILGVTNYAVNIIRGRKPKMQEIMDKVIAYEARTEAQKQLEKHETNENQT